MSAARKPPPATLSRDDETTAASTASPSAFEIIACWDAEVVAAPLGAEPVVVGRGEGNDLVVPHRSVSRRHARISLTSRGLEVEDLGSSNRVRADGVEITGPARLSVGSVLELGEVRVLVRATRAAQAPAVDELDRVIAKVAPSAVSLLLLGETGAGKEVLTERVHALSGRTGPLVRLNCAGLAPSLLEGELFGYERGAFTGAVQLKIGLIEAADGGTLFLDEIGEMPEAMQPKLLRVLEDKEVRRVGAIQGRRVDVRFVAATHRDLRNLAATGGFREDLLYRLSGFTLRVPPLRERRREIRGLAERFLAEAMAPRAAPALSPGARALLDAYRWPGNVRELKSVMTRVALLCDGPAVLVSDLRLDPSLAAAPAPAEEPAGASGEAARIAEALARVGGNQAAAAKALGMTPRVLGYRMDKLGLPRPRRAQ